MTLFLAFVLIMAAIAVLGRAMVRDEGPTGLARSIATLEQYSASPSELVEEAEPPFAERVLAPLQARALALGKRLTGADKAERIRHTLDVAGNPRSWTVDRVVSLKVVAAAVFPICGLAYGLLLGFGPTILIVMTGALVVLGFFAPNIYLYQCAAKRSEAVR